jgi:hypothetical protein
VAPEISHDDQVELAVDRATQRLEAVHLDVLEQAAVEREAVPVEPRAPLARVRVVQDVALGPVHAGLAEDLAQAVQQAVREVVLDVRGQEQHAREPGHGRVL